MNKKGVFWIVILILVLIGTSWYIIEAQSNKNSVSVVSTSPSSEATPSSSQLSSFWYQGKQVAVGEIALVNSIQANILPIQQISGITTHDQKTYEWEGSQYENNSGDQTVYTVDGITITNSDGKVTVAENNISPLYFKTFSDELGLYTFNFQGNNYFLESSQDCGQTCVQQYYLVRSDSMGNVDLIGTSPSSTMPLWNGSSNDFIGAVTIGNDLYLVDNQNNGIYTAIINANGFERMTIASNTNGSVDLGTMITNWGLGS